MIDLELFHKKWFSFKKKLCKILEYSVIFAICYAFLNSILVWAFGSKPTLDSKLETVYVFQITSELSKVIILPWASWKSIFPNSVAFFIFSFVAIWIVNSLNSKLKKDKSSFEGIGIVMWTGLTLGIISRFFNLGLEFVLGFVICFVLGAFFDLKKGLVFGISFGTIILLLRGSILGTITLLISEIATLIGASLVIFFRGIFNKELWKYLWKEFWRFLKNSVK